MRVVKVAEGDHLEPDPGWRRISLAGSGNISVEYFEKPPGHASPMHDHPQEQVCIVICGLLRAVAENGAEAELTPGDSVWFAPNESHRIENPSDAPATGVDIFAPGRPFSFWMEKSPRD